MKKMLTIIGIFSMIFLLSGCNLRQISENEELKQETQKSENLNTKENINLNIDIEKNKVLNERTTNKSLSFYEKKMLIIEYYYFLTNKQFEKASKLVKKGKTEKELSSAYGNIKAAIPYNIRYTDSGNYIFDVYYVEEGDIYSKTYEVIKRIEDGMLINISSKEKTTVKPEEFSLINDNGKYEIFLEGEIKFQNLFSSTKESIEYYARESLDIFANKEALTPEQNKLLANKINYFKEFFKRYSDNDIIKIYRIRDKTFVNGKEETAVASDDYLEEMSDDGIRFYLIKNKGIYSKGDKQFFEDFRATSGIPDTIPLNVGDEYFVLEMFSYCGASACPFKADEIREMIKSESFIIK